MIWNPRIGELYVYSIQEYTMIKTFGLAHITQVYPVLKFKKEDNTEFECAMTPYYSYSDKCFTFYHNSIMYRFVKLENDDHINIMERLEQLELRSKLQPISELDLESALNDHLHRIEVQLASATQMVQDLYNKLKEKEKEIDVKQKEVDKLQICLDTQLRNIPNVR